MIEHEHVYLPVRVEYKEEEKNLTHIHQLHACSGGQMRVDECVYSLFFLILIELVTTLQFA